MKLITAEQTEVGKYYRQHNEDGEMYDIVSKRRESDLLTVCYWGHAPSIKNENINAESLFSEITEKEFKKRLVEVKNRLGI